MKESVFTLVKPEIKSKWQNIFKEYAGTAAAEPNRNILITPYFGHYGLAGYVITVEGSPVRGTLVYSLAENLMCIPMGGRSPKNIRLLDLELEKASSMAKRLWSVTRELLKALDLSLDTGNGESPAVYIISGEEIAPIP
jgi:hypothetical protein